jgi:lysophospholipase L1-like esterase
MNQRTLRPSANLRYQAQIKNLFGNALIGYWPLDEISGTTVLDVSGNGHNGSYTDIAQLAADSTGPFQSASPLFTNSIANVYSAGFAGAFNPLEFTISLWVKMGAAWSDGAAHYLFGFSVDNNNEIILYKDATNHAITCAFVAGGTGNILYPRRLPGATQWANIILSVSRSNNRMTVYLNGGPWAATTPNGTWAGALTSDRAGIGSRYGTVKLGTMTGNLSHGWVLDREISAAEAKQTAAAGLWTPKRFTYLGDSITANLLSWSDLLSVQYGIGFNTNSNRSSGGTTIMAHLDGQADAAANDDADIIIHEHGTNDDNDGDMLALQAKIESNIIKLKASNPRAQQFYLGVLPRWTDNTGATSVDKSNIRAAQQAACIAQGITYWDTFTAPWITPDQTTDGTHLAATGNQAVTTQVLARLP